MTRFGQKSFTVGVGSDAYRDNYDRIFRPKGEEALELQAPIRGVLVPTFFVLDPEPCTCPVGAVSHECPTHGELHEAPRMNAEADRG